MKRLRSSALALALALAGCASDPATFTTFTHRDGQPAGPVSATAAPRYSDALALNYANFVESEFRARASGARHVREGSNTALAGLSGFTAAAGTLAYSASTVTGLGLASGGIVQLQQIFNARARSSAYGEAAVRIHSAIKDYVALNLNHVSETAITPNGWTLANIVQANVDMVDKVLNGHLPTPEDLVQASEPMSVQGATPQPTGSVPVNNIPTNRGQRIQTIMGKFAAEDVYAPTRSRFKKSSDGGAAKVVPHEEKKPAAQPVEAGLPVGAPDLDKPAEQRFAKDAAGHPLVENGRAVLEKRQPDGTWKRVNP